MCSARALLPARDEVPREEDDEELAWNWDTRSCAGESDSDTGSRGRGSDRARETGNARLGGSGSDNEDDHDDDDSDDDNCPAAHVGSHSRDARHAWCDCGCEHSYESGSDDEYDDYDGHGVNAYGPASAVTTGADADVDADADAVAAAEPLLHEYLHGLSQSYLFPLVQTPSELARTHRYQPPAPPSSAELVAHRPAHGSGCGAGGCGSGSDGNGGSCSCGSSGLAPHPPMFLAAERLPVSVSAVRDLVSPVAALRRRCRETWEQIRANRRRAEQVRAREEAADASRVAGAGDWLAQQAAAAAAAAADAAVAGFGGLDDDDDNDAGDNIDDDDNDRVNCDSMDPERTGAAAFAGARASHQKRQQQHQRQQGKQSPSSSSPPSSSKYRYPYTDTSPPTWLVSPLVAITPSTPAPLGVLRSLNLSLNPLGDAGFRALARYIADPAASASLQALNVSGCRVLDSGTRALARAVATNTALQELVLARVPFYADAARDLGDALAVNASLRRLDLGHTNFTARAARQLAPGLALNRGLVDLNLAENELSGLGAAVIMRAVELGDSIKVLLLTDNGITAEASLALTSLLLHTSSLLSLDLSANPGLGAALGTALHLAYVRRPTVPVTRLNLSSCALLDAELHLACDALSGAVNLRELFLDNNKFDVPGAMSAVVLLLSPYLTHLSLARNRIQDTGITQALGSALARTHLRRLDLRQNRLRDTGMTALANALMRNTHLTEVDIQEEGHRPTPFNPRAALEAADFPPQLRRAWIIETRVRVPIAAPALAPVTDGPVARVPVPEDALADPAAPADAAAAAAAAAALAAEPVAAAGAAGAPAADPEAEAGADAVAADAAAATASAAAGAAAAAAADSAASDSAAAFSSGVGPDAGPGFEYRLDVQLTVPLSLIDACTRRNDLRQAEAAVAALAHGLHPRLGADSALHRVFAYHPLADPAVLGGLVDFLYSPYPKGMVPVGAQQQQRWQQQSNVHHQHQQQLAGDANGLTPQRPRERGAREMGPQIRVAGAGNAQ
jgi:Ran GTPase-activating protein (RanGAP) involved in mRNA processing and transport